MMTSSTSNTPWHFSVTKNRYAYVYLFPEQTRLTKEQPPLVRFVLQFKAGSTEPSVCRDYENKEIQISTPEDFSWPVNPSSGGPYLITVEFLDMKIMNGGVATPVRPSGGLPQSLSSQSTLSCLSRMFQDGIHADITINTAEGSLKAHKAMLVAKSTVFKTMFSHDLKETTSSTIDIVDMSLESCTALLSVICMEHLKYIFEALIYVVEF